MHPPSSLLERLRCPRRIENWIKDIFVKESHQFFLWRHSILSFWSVKRQASAAAGSGSAADAGGSRLHTLVRQGPRVMCACSGGCVATERKAGKFILPIPLIGSTESSCSYSISAATHCPVMGVGKELCKISDRRPPRKVGRPSEDHKNLSCWA